eukprot:TRINITY_DN2869_c0_g1_i1.p1 TRINITY_DN2869_c0_g1~~TRINITY_DN2869_c0_g1_i1.p1  ORF type:complete len:751 (-),score=138.62 TRINITY_DN2869_c0_g1_i1:119-2371(-)
MEVDEPPHAHAPHHGHGHAHAHAATASEDQPPPLRKEITTPTFADVSQILLRCSCGMMNSKINFGDEATVRESWDMIMDGAMPLDGRRQLVRSKGDGSFWLLRNEPSTMPYNPDTTKFPDYGQFTDEELRTLNNWGEQNGLRSFRAAVNTCGPVNPGGVSAPGSRSSKLIRYSVDEIYNNPLFLSQILDAFRALQDPTLFPRVNQENKHKVSDLGEWGDLISIHGGPWQVYSNKDKGLGMWCWHNAFQFLPWHRPWLAAVEGGLAAAQTSLGYANPIGLPYWDQTEPYVDAEGNKSYKNGHPIFFDPTYVSVRDGVTYDNPLCAKNARSLFNLEDGTPRLNEKPRRIIRGWPQASFDESNNSQDFVKKTIGPNESWDEIIDKWDDSKYHFDFSEVKYPNKDSETTLVEWMRQHLAMAPQQPNFYSRPNHSENADVARLGWAQWIETVHNQIHNWIGLDCQNASIAGFDPILYFFHSNIDRELQAVIDNFGEEFIPWLSQTPDGTPDHANEMTLLHMPVPFPPELEKLLCRRLGKFELPVYKDCFKLDYFQYDYSTPFVFPSLEEVGLGGKRPSWISVVAPMPPMNKSRIDVFKGNKLLGSSNTLGMSMTNGRMRMFHMPAFLDPILLPRELSGEVGASLRFEVTADESDDAHAHAHAHAHAPSASLTAAGGHSMSHGHGHGVGSGEMTLAWGSSRGLQPFYVKPTLESLQGSHESLLTHEPEKSRKRPRQEAAAPQASPTKKSRTRGRGK